MMAVTVGAVWMAMPQLVRGGGTHGEHFDLEIEHLSRKRVLRIDQHLLTLDARDPNRRVLAVGTFGHELHARYELHVRRESRTRHRLRRDVFSLTVAILRLDPHFASVADGLAGQRLLEPRDDVVRPVQVAIGSSAVEASITC